MKAYEFVDNSGFIFTVYAYSYMEACKIARGEIER